MLPLSDVAMQVLHCAVELSRSHGVVFTNPACRRRDSGLDDPPGDAAGGRCDVAARVPLDVPDLGAGARRELGGLVVASYARSDMVETRRALMERYAGALG